MKLNEIEVILFDLGNVVIEIDFSRVISEWQKFSGKNNIEITKDSILGRANKKYERGEISTAQFIESLKKELDLDITDEEVLEGWNNWSPPQGLKRLLRIQKFTGGMLLILKTIGQGPDENRIILD